MKRIQTLFFITILALLVPLLGECAGKKAVSDGPVKKADPVCMESCSREKCPDYAACMKPCDALGTNPKAQPCKVRCELRLTQCKTGCEAHCNAMQPQ